MALEGLTRYQIMDSLGRGSQGQTFRAIDRTSGREVAVKVLHLAGLDNWKLFDLFERECAVLATLQHPGIPRFVDRFASEDSGDFFLVRELVQGESLAELLERRERISEDSLIDLLRQGLDILDYLHHRQPPLIHRDIKPGNLIRRPDGRLILIDFGGVRNTVGTEGGSTLIGTYGYMAPEQLHGQATAATDLFSLAATIVALATRQEPETLPRKGLRIDLSLVMEPGRLRDVLDRMLAPDPDQRPSSARVVLAELEKISESTAGTSAPKTARRRNDGTAAPRAGQTAASTPPGAPPDRDATSLAIIEPLARLALVSRPLHILVWLVAALASGLLTVLEVVLVPLAFAVGRAMAKHPQQRKRLEARRFEFVTELKHRRQSFAQLAERTHPSADNEPDQDA